MTELDGSGNYALGISDVFLRKTRRRGIVVLSASWAFAQIGFWWGVLSGSLGKIGNTQVMVVSVLITIAWVLIGLLVFWVEKQSCIIVTKSQVVVSYLASIKGPGVLQYSRESPIVIKKPPSGRLWKLTTPEAKSKRITVPVDAFPALDSFLKDTCCVGVPTENSIRDKK